MEEPAQSSSQDPLTFDVPIHTNESRSAASNDGQATTATNAAREQPLGRTPSSGSSPARSMNNMNTANTTNPAQKLKNKDILKAKHNKRRRMYKMAWRMLMDKIENMSEDSESDLSDDYMSDVGEERLTTVIAGSVTPGPSDVPMEGATPDPAAQEPKKEAKPPLKVVYRAEFYRFKKGSRNTQIPELQNTFEKDDPIQTAEAQDSGPSKPSSIFEVTTMYALPRTKEEYPDQHKKPKDALLMPIRAVLGSYMTIKSEIILHSLREVVKYYPGQGAALHNDSFVAMEPFCMLQHYLGDLRDHRDKMEAGSPNLESNDLSEPANAHKHITLLLDYIDNRYGLALAAEQARWDKKPAAMCTFEWVWLLFRPGTMVYAWDRIHGVLAAYMIHSHDKDETVKTDEKIKPNSIGNDETDFTPRQKILQLNMWYLDFDGDVISRCRRQLSIEPFDGEKEINSLPVFPVQYWKDPDETDKKPLRDRMIERGKVFFDVTKRSYRDYSGQTLSHPKRQVHGRIMLDSKHYYSENYKERPRWMLGDEVSGPEDDIEYEYKDGLRLKVSTDAYKHCDNIKPSKVEKLTDDQYVLCSRIVRGFVIKQREWELLDTGCITIPVMQTNLIDDLVLRPEAKEMIKALSRSYTTQAEGGGPDGRWSADFVRNKGEGQIFLLHGKPGVGKTTTAECVAELTNRPLLSLTCGDLGIQPLDVERELKKWLRLAKLWEAILLLDEADVYLENRYAHDLQRNSLVSIFLRALEYYQGILFLTTNRVGTFDDGFVSRIHVIIHYPEFTDEERSRIWEIFFRKLEKERDNIRVLQRTIDYAKEATKDLHWNGREIRNAFNTAVALAEYNNERDTKGNIMLQPRDLEQVVKMSRAFKDYLLEASGMDPAKQAAAYKLRADEWKAIGDKHL